MSEPYRHAAPPAPRIRRIQRAWSGLLIGLLVTALAGFAACSGGESRSRALIQNKGSDTLVNVAQAWAETYRRVNPEVAVAVSGGGSGTGIAALINGTVDIANASRDISEHEREQIRKAHGGTGAVEHVVAIDAVVFFVHKDNPLKGLNIQQLACIYGEGGSCDHWNSLANEVPGCVGQKIIRIGRQSNSGTYEFVRERVLGKDRDFRLGSRDMSGSKDVVDIVSKTPCAIGYSGLGYATDEIRALCVAESAGAECIVPTTETAASGEYTLSRPLYMYTLGEAQGAVADYLKWIQSKDGQKIVADNGYVPAPSSH